MTDPRFEFWNKPDFKDQQHLIAGGLDWEQSEKDAVLHRTWFETSTIKKHLDSLDNPTVLEIGCGVGRLLKAFMPDRHVVGLDISPEMIKRARGYLPDQAELYVVKDSDFGIEDKSVDFVYSFNVFQHIPSIQEVRDYLAESYKVLKNGGYIRIQTHVGKPVAEGAFDGFHGHYFPDALTFATEFKKAGFTIVEMQEKFGHELWLWVTARKEWS